MYKRENRRGNKGKRRRERREPDYVVEEVVYEEPFEDPYGHGGYVEEHRPSFPWGLIIAGLAILALIVGLIMYKRNRRRAAMLRGAPYASQATVPQAPPMQAVNVGKPVIDLKAVEKALWETKSKSNDGKDFSAWMKAFEDEVNAIYFATLKRQNPNADPTTLLPSPVRVAPQWDNSLLSLVGYVDKNKQKGYQTSDKLLFKFRQTQPYQKDSKKLHYSLHDARGYYHRAPGYTHTISSMAVPMFMGFFLYSTWQSMWWRSSFGWYGSPGWYSTGPFYRRTTYYYGRYPSYRRSYRTSYYNRYRPWGWNRGTYFRRSRSGSYTYRRSTPEYRSYRQNYYRRRGYRSGSPYGGRYRNRQGYGGRGTRSYGSRQGYGSGTRRGYGVRGTRGGYGTRSRGRYDNNREGYGARGTRGGYGTRSRRGYGSGSRRGYGGRGTRGGYGTRSRGRYRSRGYRGYGGRRRSRR